MEDGRHKERGVHTTGWLGDAGNLVCTSRQRPSCSPPHVNRPRLW